MSARNRSPGTPAQAAGEVSIMIEFKAECGHTVRAKDDSAGGVVRCSYCGHEATVPDDKADGLDFLFSEVDQNQASTSATPPKHKRGRGAFFKRRRSGGGVDPFAVVFKLCWAALVIVVVVVVGQRFVLPLFQEDGFVQRVADAKDSKPRNTRKNNRKRPPPRATAGLTNQDKLQGLFVSSTPPGATVFYVDIDRAPQKGRINLARGVKQFRADGATSCAKVSDGRYLVEVVFPWNDKSLTGFEGYTAFRRAVENATDAERRRLLDQYFLPDDAQARQDVFIDQTVDQIYIVRQYRDVLVSSGQATAVRALFLPRVLAADGKSLAIETLVRRYIPTEIHYAFDKDHVLNELMYYGVASVDQPYVLEALQRIGIIPYVTPDGQTRLLKIGITDGRFAARVIRDGKP